MSTTAYPPDDLPAKWGVSTDSSPRPARLEGITNDVMNELKAIVTELGTNPSGAAADLTARLAAIEASLPTTTGNWQDLGNLGPTEVVFGDGPNLPRYSGTLDQNCTVDFSGLALNEQVLFRFKQDTIGGRTFTATGVVWETNDGNQPTFDTSFGRGYEILVRNILGTIWARIEGSSLFPDATAAIRGVWALRAFTTTTAAATVTAINAAATELNAALAFSGIRGFSVRVTLASIFDGTTFDPSPLVAAKAFADAHGVSFSVRFMVGQWMPTAMKNDPTLRTYTDSDKTYSGCASTVGSAVITKTAGSFQAVLVGCGVTGGPVASGASIIAVAGDGSSITMSAPATSTSGTFTLTVQNDPTSGGMIVPAPFLDNANSGVPNAVFENYYDLLLSQLVPWCRANGVHELHCGWYSHDFAELYHNPPVRALNGYTLTRFVAAHKRLIDIALSYAGNGLIVEFPLSGSGPLSGPTGVSAQLAQYMLAAAGPDSNKIMFQANGWGQVLNVAIASVSESGNTVTCTTTPTTGKHGLKAGDTVQVSGVTANAGYNITATVLATGLTNTAFQYTAPTSGMASGAAVGIVRTYKAPTVGSAPTPIGAWGNSSLDTENGFDDNILQLAIRRGLQMIQPTNNPTATVDTWQAVFDYATEFGATTVEVYTGASFTGGNAGALQTAITNFVPA